MCFNGRLIAAVEDDLTLLGQRHLDYALERSVTALSERAAGAQTIIAPAARRPRPAHPGRLVRLRPVSMSVLALILSVLAGFAAAQEAPSPLATRTLSDRAFTIPTDLPSGPVVLIVGFTKASRTQTSAWSKKLADSTPEPVFQVAILEDVPSLIRRFVVGSIKADVPQTLHSRFLVVTQGAADWKALCSIPHEDAACVLLLGPNRQVVWRSSGDATEQSTSVLRSQIAGLRFSRKRT